MNNARLSNSLETKNNSYVKFFFNFRYLNSKLDSKKKVSDN